MAQWLHVNEAAEVLGIHARTLRRHVESGKRASKKEEGKLMIQVEAHELVNGKRNGNPNGDVIDIKALLDEKDKRIAALESQRQAAEKSFSELLSRFEELQADASESRIRSDSIIMQLSKTVENQHAQIAGQTVLLEDLRTPKTLWQRIWQKKRTASFGEDGINA